MRTCCLCYKTTLQVYMKMTTKVTNSYECKMMLIVSLTSIVMTIIMMINVVTWYYAGNAPINVDDVVDHSNDDSSGLMISLPSLLELSSSSVKEKVSHRRLRLSMDSLKDGQLAVIALAILPNENIHIASNQHSYTTDIDRKTTSSSSLPYASNNYSTMLTKNNHKIRYVDDSLCIGCRYVYTSNEVNEASTTCWNEIERLLSVENNDLSMVEAAMLVSTLYPNNCHRCNPNSCTDNEKKYYRPDDIISNQDIGYARTHFLKSIDSNDRLPLNILTSRKELKTFLQNPYNLWPHREYFAEFNPSIVHLPKSQIPKQLLLLQGEGNTDDSYYLASYRVSTAYHCFNYDDEVIIRNDEQNVFKSNDFLGIAILDIHLNILLETVVGIRGVVIPSIPGMISDDLYQDGRLFTLNDQLYLGSYTMLFPIWLVPPISNNNHSNTADESEAIVKMPYYMTSEQKINTNYNHSERTNSLLDVYIHRSGHCSNDKKFQMYGKSYNYFYDINKQRIVSEIYPMLQKEHFDTTSCQLSNKYIDFIVPDKPIPLDSYSTTDEIDLSRNHQIKLPFSGDRGSHCCLSVNEPQYYYPKYTNQTSLLIGVSHIQSKKQRNRSSFRVQGFMYFHSFYAMEPVEPYNIVARSGRFCLGYPKYDGNNNTSNHDGIHYKDTRWGRKLNFGTEFYDCAKMHFITGITEALHDPNQIIISYGVDDCYSRFIMISKKHILSLLFDI